MDINYKKFRELKEQIENERREVIRTWRKRLADKKMSVLAFAKNCKVNRNQFYEWTRELSLPDDTNFEKVEAKLQELGV